MVDPDGFVPGDADRSTLLDRVTEIVDESNERADRTIRDDYVEFDSTVVRKSVLLDSIFDRLPVHTFVKDERAPDVLVSRAFTNDPDSMLDLRDVDVDHIPDEQAEKTDADDLEEIRDERPIIDKEERFRASTSGTSRRRSRCTTRVATASGCSGSAGTSPNASATSGKYAGKTDDSNSSRAS